MIVFGLDDEYCMYVRYHVYQSNFEVNILQNWGPTVYCVIQVFNYVCLRNCIDTNFSAACSRIDSTYTCSVCTVQRLHTCK